MKRDNLILLGLGALIAYLIFKPKSSVAVSPAPSPEPSYSPPPNPTGVPLTSLNITEGNKYILTLARDFAPFKKGDKLTGIFYRINQSAGIRYKQLPINTVSPAVMEEVFRVQMPMQGDARPREYDIPMRNFVEYLR